MVPLVLRTCPTPDRLEGPALACACGRRPRQCSRSQVRCIGGIAYRSVGVSWCCRRRCLEARIVLSFRGSGGSSAWPEDASWEASKVDEVVGYRCHCWKGVSEMWTLISDIETGVEMVREATRRRPRGGLLSSAVSPLQVEPRNVVKTSLVLRRYNHTEHAAFVSCCAPSCCAPRHLGLVTAHAAISGRPGSVHPVHVVTAKFRSVRSPCFVFCSPPLNPFLSNSFGDAESVVPHKLVTPLSLICSPTTTRTCVAPAEPLNDDWFRRFRRRTRLDDL